MNKTIYIPDSFNKDWIEAQRILASREVKMSEFIIVKIRQFLYTERDVKREATNEDLT